MSESMPCGRDYRDEHDVERLLAVRTPKGDVYVTLPHALTKVERGHALDCIAQMLRKYGHPVQDWEPPTE